MPEGDTVYRSARNLNAALAGQVLTRCDIRVPAFATVDLTGETIEGVASRGKHLLMHVGEYTLHSHLKMEGSWHLYRPDERWRGFGFERPLVEPLSAFGYLLSLGFRRASLLPMPLVPAVAALDRLSSPLASWTGLRAALTWRRTRRC